MAEKKSLRNRFLNWLKADMRSTSFVGGDQVREKTRKYGPIVGALWAFKCWVVDTWAGTEPYGPHKESPSYIPMPEEGTAKLYDKQPRLLRRRK
ncbi:hypothetical protein SAMN05216355_103112 [Actinomyces ruminicola]|uniref:Uncharacterized protein n=1 Tax=Actinomyces ruminicola TaxID=332524 RepID=A0A1H0B6U9_9ACTO|nr:hypothetical protein [Actinomyces ruminicola]SDN41341.1 hypothetical protein SAMN05216355_103112 [Actinomyces ruminicola]